MNYHKSVQLEKPITISREIRSSCKSFRMSSPVSPSVKRAISQTQTLYEGGNDHRLFLHTPTK